MFKRYPIKELEVPVLLAVVSEVTTPLVSGPQEQGAACDLSQGRLSEGEWIPQPTVVST